MKVTKLHISETNEMRQQIQDNIKDLKSLQLWVRDFQLSNRNPSKENLNDICSMIFNIYSSLDKI